MLITGYKHETINKIIAGVLSACRKEEIINPSDLIEIEAEKSTISIKQVRSLLGKLSLTPVGPRKLVIIRNVHQLSLPAANALLKSLEETSQFVRFLLVTPWPSRLPITVLSRCVKARLDESSPTNNELSEITKENLSGIEKAITAHGIEKEDVDNVGDLIGDQLRRLGPRPHLKMAAMRLVDYYRVRERGGNEKLAREVLMMYLPDILRK